LGVFNSGEQENINQDQDKESPGSPYLGEVGEWGVMGEMFRNTEKPVAEKKLQEE